MCKLAKLLFNSVVDVHLTIETVAKRMMKAMKKWNKESSDNLTMMMMKMLLMMPKLKEQK